MCNNSETSNQSHVTPMCIIALIYNGSSIRSNNAVTHNIPLMFKNILELKHNIVRRCRDTVIFPWTQIKQNYGRNKTVGKVLLAAAQTDHYPFKPKKLLLLLSPAFAVVVICCFCTSWRCYYSRMLFLYIIYVGGVNYIIRDGWGMFVGLISTSQGGPQLINTHSSS